MLLFNSYENRKAKEQAENTLKILQKLAPAKELVKDEDSALNAPNGAVDQYIPDYILDPNMEMPTVDINGDKYIGTLYFPSLKIELPVMSSWSYPDLKKAPCLYSGSIYAGNAVIAAHNYAGHFGRLAKLSPADTVYFTDVDGNRFSYEVVLEEVLEPTSVEEMTANNYDLSLFTCTLGGESRFTVRCDRR